MPGHGIAQGDALVEGGEGTEADPPAQRRLSDQQAGEGCVAVHLGVREEPQPFELLGVEQVGLVEDKYDPAAPLVLFGGQGVLGLRDERGPVKARDPAECRHDARVQAPCPDGRVAEIDDGVAAGVDAGQCARTATVLPAPTSPVTTPITRSSMHQVIRADRFGVGAMGVEHGGGEVLGKGHAGEAPVGPEAVDGHCWFSLYSSLVVVVSVG